MILTDPQFASLPKWARGFFNEDFEPDGKMTRQWLFGDAPNEKVAVGGRVAIFVWKCLLPWGQPAGGFGIYPPNLTKEQVEDLMRKMGAETRKFLDEQFRARGAPAAPTLH